MFFSFYESPVGKLTIIEENEMLTHLHFGEAVPNNGIEQKSDLLRLAQEQLQEYFDGTRKEFALPVDLKGSEFMKKVWGELKAIPYGTTVSYKDISRAIGQEKAYRAVGMANNRNPLPIIIPCHRVIASDGKLCGYGGGIHIKQYLLESEKKHSKR